MIVSSSPGRIRLRSPQLKNPKTLNNLQVGLQKIPEIHTVTVDPKVGSLLIIYDPKAIDLERMKAKLEALGAVGSLGSEKHVAPEERGAVKKKADNTGTGLGGGLDGLDDPETPLVSGGRNLPAINLGQGVKAGMLATLGSSLYWAALGKKGPHKQTGGLFLVSLAVHMWMHRRRLFK